MPPALEVQSLDCQGHPNLGTFLSQFSPLEKTQFRVRHLWAQIFHPLSSIQPNKCLSSIYGQQESIRNNWLQVTENPTYRVKKKKTDSFFSCEKFRRHSDSDTASVVKIIRDDICDYFAYLSWVQDNSYSSIFIHMNPYSREGEKEAILALFCVSILGKQKISHNLLTDFC